MLKQAIKVTLADDVVRQISELIRTGQWKVGDQLPPERQLAETLGVSRNTLREALKALSLMGVLESRQGGGNYVSENINRRVMASSLQFLDLSDKKVVLDLLETRKLLEAYCASLAARNATPELVEKLRFNCGMIAANTDNTVEASKYDVEYHMLLSDVADNVFLSEMLQICRSPSVSVMLKTTYMGDLMDKTVHYHEKITDAISRGDAGEASKLMEQHLASVEDYIRVYL